MQNKLTAHSSTTTKNGPLMSFKRKALSSSLLNCNLRTESSCIFPRFCTNQKERDVIHVSRCLTSRVRTNQKIQAEEQRNRENELSENR